MTTSIQVTVINKLGLHARAAARFVRLAAEYESDISLTHNGRRVNGKSIMGVMMLAAGMGSCIGIEADGGDAEQALEALNQLIQDRFGEAE